MSDLMYTPLENVFADTLAREGKSITAVISGKTFTAFFRRCDDGQSTEDRIIQSPIHSRYRLKLWRSSWG